LRRRRRRHDFSSDPVIRAICRRFPDKASEIPHFADYQANNRSGELASEAIMGRKATFTAQIADTICARISNGESLRQICEGADMPGRQTVLDWLDDDGRLDFRAKYERARVILTVADACTNETAQADRVKIDAYKWRAAKLAPKRYGDKLAIGGDDGAPPIKAALTVSFV
jgi:hypothetical protein